MSSLRSERGSAVVELALMTPFMVVMFYVIWQLGILMSAQQTVNYAAREAARVAATRTNQAQAYEFAKTVLKDLPETDQEPQVEIVGKQERGETVFVTVSYTYSVDVLVFKLPKTVTGEAAMRREI